MSHPEKTERGHSFVVVLPKKGRLLFALLSCHAPKRSQRINYSFKAANIFIEFSKNYVLSQFLNVRLENEFFMNIQLVSLNPQHWSQCGFKPVP